MTNINDVLSKMFHDFYSNNLTEKKYFVISDENDESDINFKMITENEFNLSSSEISKEKCNFNYEHRHFGESELNDKILLLSSFIVTRYYLFLTSLVNEEDDTESDDELTENQKILKEEFIEHKEKMIEIFQLNMANSYFTIYLKENKSYIYIFYDACN